MSERLTHVGLCVREIDRSVDFYCDGLGFQQVGRMRASGERCERLLDVADADLELVYLERDGFRLELIGFLSPEAEGNGHPGESTHLDLRICLFASMTQTSSRLDWWTPGAAYCPSGKSSSMEGIGDSWS